MRPRRHECHCISIVPRPESHTLRKRRVGEGVVTNVCPAGGKLDRRQRGAALKGKVADPQASGQND